MGNELYWRFLGGMGSRGRGCVLNGSEFGREYRWVILDWLGLGGGWGNGR